VLTRPPQHNNSNGKPEELLIDFQELMGEHSGGNMADVVWTTLVKYGLVGRVRVLLSSLV
jgi:hypothetical protein